VAGTQRVVLIHGAATTSRVWRRVVPLLEGFDVRCPDRPCSGDLAAEVAVLGPACAGAVVAGVSGGATLGLALAAAGVPVAAAVLHEPAVGSLLPGLLDEMRAAYQAGGTAAFADARRQRPQDAFAPLCARGQLAALARHLPKIRALGGQRVEQRNRRTARIVRKEIARDREGLSGLAFDQRGGILVGFGIFDR